MDVPVRCDPEGNSKLAGLGEARSLEDPHMHATAPYTAHLHDLPQKNRRRYTNSIPQRYENEIFSRKICQEIYRPPEELKRL